jgi:hypothetical protein
MKIQIIKLLELFFYKNPQIRLGQIVNICASRKKCDTFYITDEDMIKELYALTFDYKELNIINELRENKNTPIEISNDFLEETCDFVIIRNIFNIDFTPNNKVRIYLQQWLYELFQ